MKFFKCEKCGKIVAIVKETSCGVFCCNEKMKEIIANTVDAAKEKHVPKVEVSGNIVNVEVGSVLHPMTDEHLIEWVALETEQGNQRKVLKANTDPKISFAMCDGDKVKSVYAYCNLHGLWKV